MTLLLATRNRHKARELRQLLNGTRLRLEGAAPLTPPGARLRLLCADDFSGLPAVREDGATLRANAVKKAVVTSRRTILPVLAEDSGLEVRALEGRPGVRSARYARPQKPHRRVGPRHPPGDRANVAKLLKEMSKVPPSRRQARFVCVMALAAGGKLLRTFKGISPGSIALKPRGKGGFGYDPVFIPRGFHKTMAEMSLFRKNRLSHRGRAAARFSAWIRKTL